MGRVERAALLRKEGDSAKSGYDAAFNGGAVYGAAVNQGADSSDAIFAGIVTAAATWLLDNAQKNNELNEVRRQEVEAAGVALRRKMSVIAARADNAVDDLTSANSWKKDPKRSAG